MAIVRAGAKRQGFIIHIRTSNMEKTSVHIGTGYGGGVKVRATIDGEDFVIEKAEAERILAWVIRDGKTMKTQTKRMIYPRLKLIEQ